MKIRSEVKLSNPIEEQRQLIDKLYLIVKGSCPEKFQKAKCKFVYEVFSDGSSSVGQEFYYTQNSEEISGFLARSLRRPVTGLVKELHSKMNAHTGGNWNAFTLFINEDSTVTTKFEYPTE